MKNLLSTKTGRTEDTRAIFHLDREGCITGLNRNAERISGRPLAELFGRPFQDLFAPDDDIASLTGIFDRLDPDELPIRQFHLLELRQNGSRMEVLTTIMPIWGRDRSVTGALVTLDTNNEAFVHQTLLDSVPEGILTVNRNLEIVSFNAAARQITGWSLDEVLGQNCQLVFPPELCENKCLIRSAIEQAIPFSAQTIYMHHKDGHAFPLSLSTSPLFDLNGKVIGAVQTFHDCSASLLNDLILASVADGVFTIDHDRTITSFNRAAEHITGWTQAEVVGKPCREIFHSSVCGDNCLLQMAIDRTSMFVDRAIFIKGKAGNSIPVTVSSSPLFDDFGNIIGGIETFRDNTSSICGRNCAIAESLYKGTPAANRSITIVNSRGDKVPISISAAPLTDHEGNIIGGVETFRDLSVITELRQQLSQRYTFDSIISKSPAMQRLFTILPDIARSPSTVLILGESGTGKELIARSLYNASERAEGPFVAVNCAALPETLLESELFGYKAGAFTDARKDRIGRFAAAEGGTLFLDEIGDLPGPVQVKLLRVLQDKVYEPLGSNTPVKADVRIITATNRNLEELVRAGAFRDDLFYRLNVVRISLPPLRERKEDIPLLIEHFIKKYSAQQGKDIVGMANEALAILMRHDFPGNIRELENIVEYAFILCEGGYIQPEHLPEPFAAGVGAEETVQPMMDRAEPRSLEEIEKQAISRSLERNYWRKMVTCRELGISKDTLRRKIERYGLVNPFADEGEDD